MTEREHAFDDFLLDVLRELSRGVPEYPTQMGLFDIAGESIPQNYFTDISDQGAVDRQQTLQTLAASLAEFSRSSMSSCQQLSADVLDFFFNYAHERDWVGLKGRDFLRHKYLIRPSEGLHSDLPLFLSDLHPMRHEQDADDYMDRLCSIAPLLTEATELVVERQRDGLSPPRFLIQASIREIDAFKADEPTNNVLYQAFANKSLRLPGLATHQREKMLANIEREIHDHIYPTYARLAETLAQLERDAHDEPGLWRLPNGDAYYDFLLRSATTTSMSAEEIHELGLAETEKLESEIMSACRELGHDVKSMADCVRVLDQGRSTTADDSNPRHAIVHEVENLIEQIEGHLPGLFYHLPKGKVVVKPIAEFAESSRNQTLQPSSLDGSRPALFELNVGQLLAGGNSKNELPTLVYHEIYPGHHLQMALALESETLPLFRRIITFDAYIEGWAKYAEAVPWTHGINKDPHWRVSRMCRELISTVNLVVDTGIHTKRWSVETAVGYLRDHTGLDDSFTTYLVHRSAAVPAQMCAYKIGMLKVLALKDRMSKAHGDSFDIRCFHDVILRNGAVPLVLLDNIVDREIESGDDLSKLGHARDDAQSR